MPNGLGVSEFIGIISQAGRVDVRAIFHVMVRWVGRVRAQGFLVAVGGVPVTVGGVPVTVAGLAPSGVTDGVEKIGSKVQVGALVRVGTSVEEGMAVRVGVDVQLGVIV